MGLNQTPEIAPPESPIAQQNKIKPKEQIPMGRNAKVAALQKDLLAAGADLGPFENDGVDGLMGTYTRAAMAQFPEITAKHPEAAKMPDAPPGSGKAIKGAQRTNPSAPEKTDGGEPPKAQDTKPRDPNSIRPEVKAMADLLDTLVKQAKLNESLRNNPTEQIKQYRSIVEKADQNIDEYTNNSWIGGSPAPGQNFGQKALSGITTAGNMAKRAVPFIGAGFGIFGAGGQLSKIQKDFEEGDLGSAALGTLSALAYGLSIPLAFGTSWAAGAGGIAAGLAGSSIGSAADARRATRGGRKVADMVDQIQAKLKDPNNGFTPAESKLLDDKVSQVRAQLIRNNIPIDL